jgi:hypothetical protein
MPRIPLHHPQPATERVVPLVAAHRVWPTGREPMAKQRSDVPVALYESICALGSANASIPVLGPFRHEVWVVALVKGFAGVWRYIEVPLPDAHKPATESFDIDARQVGPMVLREVAREARSRS